jgi:hypothetical protein
MRHGADAGGSIASARCKRSAIDNANGAARGQGLDTNGSNNLGAYGSDAAAVLDAHRTADVLTHRGNAKGVIPSRHREIAAVHDS